MKIKSLLVLSCFVSSNICYAQLNNDYYLIHNQDLSDIVINQLNYCLSEEKLHNDQQENNLSQMERALIHHDDIAYHYWLDQYNEMISVLNEDSQNETSLWFEFNQEYNEKK